MTQRQLAEAMQARGWKWSQTTVHTVEQGTRPLRLTESEDLREIFGQGYQLTLADADTQLVTAIGDARAATAAVERAVRQFLDAQFNVSHYGSQASPELQAEAQEFEDDSPERIVHRVRNKIGVVASIVDYEGVPGVQYSEEA